MKYIFELSSRIDSSIEKKHLEVTKGLTSIEKPWGIDEGKYPTPEFGKMTTAFFKLTKLLGNGIKGHVMYLYRSNLNRTDYDRINIEFNPVKINYRQFVTKIVKEYISFFNPYYANVFDEKIVVYDYERYHNNKSISNSFRFNSIVFWSKSFCKEVLNISLTDLQDRISGVVEHVELFDNGIIITTSSKFLSLDEANAIDYQLKALIGINN